MLEKILGAMKAFQWSADNVAFGSGGSLLQKMHRDTQKCAYKCSFATVAGENRDVYKEPVTDKAKKSKKGTKYHHPLLSYASLLACPLLLAPLLPALPIHSVCASRPSSLRLTPNGFDESASFPSPSHVIDGPQVG